MCKTRILEVFVTKAEKTDFTFQRRRFTYIMKETSDIWKMWLKCEDSLLS